MSNEEKIDQLMVTIRKHTEDSKCISTFEKLLHEIEDENVLNVVLKNMNQFIEHFFTICREVDKVYGTSIKANMLSYAFIKPERFFNESSWVTSAYSTLAITLTERFKDNAELPFILFRDNRLGFTGVIAGVVDTYPGFIDADKDTCDLWIERCRKVDLLWNYLPAIVKAFIQAKRRSIGLDKNSKRFK